MDGYKHYHNACCNHITYHTFNIYIGMFRLTNMGIVVFVARIYLKRSSNE